jgi:hypothetical protein
LNETKKIIEDNLENSIEKVEATANSVIGQTNQIVENIQ